MANFQPPPTWALPILVEERSGRAIFNPIWLKWFVDLTAVLDAAGGTTPNIHNNLNSIQGGGATERYHLTNAEHTNLTVGFTGTGNLVRQASPTITGNLTLSKTSGQGIKVDPTTPTFGWRDILGPIGVKTVGATEPVWALYRGTIYAYTFDTATAEAFCTFHVPHDYVPGSDIFIHMHWSQIVVDTGGPAGVPGNAEWNFDITYADGHGTAGGAADPFVAPITVTVVQQGSTTQYGHMIAEVQFTNNGGTGGLLDSATIQVDGLFQVRVYRVKGNPADTLNQAPFGHTCDLHYQSTNMATKNKSPNFYT